MEDPLGKLMPSEVEFIAEDAPITITPNFQAGVFLFLKERVGPFKPQRPMEVPMWLAVSLRRRDKCVIHVPEWLSVDALTTKLEEEKMQQKQFVHMPAHFQEISSILFDVASQDVPNSEECRQLIQAIVDVRTAKIRQGGLDDMKDSLAIQLNNVTQMEITSIRQFACHAMDAFNRLSSV
ncbi:hypothetical protein PTSG_09891 [Salpingoeca rosetta]|uniref:DNA replication complex GINS protein PSF2 n=1 Tax=Salpingoeca rosetta (strain ATCC 50818 / BSB-021) TaxID=946362 RepID=F2UNF5_SALR5|nr:uncharacterized protein PTSG_09891 [Salpingoeca rosetta]EGD79160.1 hypothetical protein PTSG_09891 [Salpingoeca rosetta]|eukprot:XP_004989245.1 hypothetical protein PTSG_09891 [Salpingoeca rosetta]